ncbi:STAS domain-containing protein [Salipiger sp. IMCC34102]|uniref:STAS domain-containing protein n=1 Tax=Salipiger sp. IMCC34102 TaxID=2510647 RepID=UPI00101C0F85|nr:STAS domain-containing protein [Salipiger sp. IMCC34102]RYH00953.1 STAS domain-containing protein [Salipiger sp. IMCC34102]
MNDAIVLPDKMPSSAVGELSRLLADASLGDTPIRIDASGVRIMGALAAEQLLRFVRTAEAANTRVEITASSECADDLRLLGLQDLLPEEEAAT